MWTFDHELNLPNQNQWKPQVESTWSIMNAKVGSNLNVTQNLLGCLPMSLMRILRGLRENPNYKGNARSCMGKIQQISKQLPI